MIGSSLCSSISSGSEGASVGVYGYMLIWDILHVAMDFEDWLWLLELGFDLDSESKERDKRRQLS